MPEPVLSTYAAPADPVRGVVLALHGGRADDTRPVMRRHASWWRMAWLARTLARSAAPEGVAVVLLRYRVRGWNAGAGPAPDPVVDGDWALGQVRERHPGVPVALLGHSMGGRAALALAGRPDVVGVVALAPWLPDGEPVRVPEGQRLVLAHGGRDRWTSAAGARAWAVRARRAGARVARHAMGPVGHFMFSGVEAWDAVAAETLGLLGTRPLPDDVTVSFDATGDAGLDLAAPVRS